MEQVVSVMYGHDGAHTDTTPSRNGGDDGLAELLLAMPEILDVESPTEVELVNHLKRLYREEVMSSQYQLLDRETPPLTETSPTHQAMDTSDELFMPYTPPEESMYAPYSALSQVWTMSILPESPSASPTSLAASPPYDGPWYSDFKDLKNDHNYATDDSQPSLDEFSHTNEAAPLVMVNPRLVMAGHSDCPVRMPSSAVLSERNLNLEVKKVDVKRRLHASLQKKQKQKQKQKREPRAARAEELKSARALIQPSTSKHGTARSSTRPYDLYADAARPTQTGGKPAAYTRRLRDCHTESMKKKTGTKRKASTSRQDEGRRSLHNELEKQRRVHLSEMFRRMQVVVPSLMEMERPSKYTVLRQTKEYFDILAAEIAESEKEVRLQTIKRDQKQRRVRNLMRAHQNILTEADFDQLSAMQD